MSAYDIALGYAERQHGVVSRRQLSACGIPSSTIASQVGSGRLIRVFPGVYAVGRGQLSWNGMWAAASLAAGNGSVLGFRSAATLWGFLDHRRTIEVVRPGGGSGFRSQVGIEGDDRRLTMHVRRAGDLIESDLTYRNGLAVTTVARTLLDLAGSLPEKGFARAFMEADRLGLLVEPQLLELVPRSRGRKGGAGFRHRVESRVPEVRLARSSLEAIFLDLTREFGLPTPEVNQIVAGHEVDFVWRSQRIVAELDGYAYHRGREAWERDVRRENELIVAGWEVYRFTWRMVNGSPEEVADAVRAAIDRGDSRQPRARQVL